MKIEKRAMNEENGGSGDSGDPSDISSINFSSEAYLNDLFRKKNLDELLQVEEDMVHNVSYLMLQFTLKWSSENFVSFLKILH